MEGSGLVAYINHHGCIMRTFHHYYARKQFDGSRGKSSTYGFCLHFASHRTKMLPLFLFHDFCKVSMRVLVTTYYLIAVLFNEPSLRTAPGLCCLN